MRNSGHTKQRSHMQQQQEQQHSALESYTGKLQNAQAVNKCSWDNACIGHVPKKKRGISVRRAQHVSHVSTNLVSHLSCIICRFTRDGRTE